MADLIFRPFNIRDGDLVAGRDDGTSLSAGVVGEIATGQVGPGGDGRLVNYQEVQLGQPPTQTTGDNSGNKAFIDLDDGKNTTDWAVSARFLGDLGGGPQGSIVDFQTVRQANNSDPRQRQTAIGPRAPIVVAGRELQFLVKNENEAITVNLSGSTIEIPALGGQ